MQVKIELTDTGRYRYFDEQVPDEDLFDELEETEAQALADDTNELIWGRR